jgi:hypothetical protein
MVKSSVFKRQEMWNFDSNLNILSRALVINNAGLDWGIDLLDLLQS